MGQWPRPLLGVLGPGAALAGPARPVFSGVLGNSRGPKHNTNSTGPCDSRKVDRDFLENEFYGLREPCVGGGGAAEMGVAED